MRRSIFLRLAVVIAGLMALISSCSNNPGYVIIGSGTRYVNDVRGPQTVTLPDNSRVLLMYGTVITLPKEFGKEGRDVDIDGEGVFLVRTSASKEVGASGASGVPGGMWGKPFVVHTGNLVIGVLDTAGQVRSGYGAIFAVSAIRKQAGEETDLLHGRLRVTKSYHSDTDSLPEELTTGDMVMINREIDLMEKEKMTGPEEDKVKAKFHLAPF